MSTTRKTYCRICEAHCGLEVELDGSKVLAVRPDRDHPVSAGYSCVKGLSLGAMHHDEARVDHPLKRVGDGFERISWPQAIAEIGQRVRALREEHGPRSLALYTGNPTYFSFQNILFSAGFLEALGSPNLFASHSIDANNKFHVSTEMYGLSLVHPVPDLDRTKLLICLGSNPMVSQMSVIAVPDAIGRLQGIEARGGRVIFIDPRRTESAEKVGEHLFIRPGTDAYLLMAMLHVLGYERPIELGPIRAVARGVNAFVECARAWTPERVEDITGIDAARIRELAMALAEAEGGSLYMSTGVNMGPFGSIAYWLLQGLNLLTGNVDREGGLVVPRGAFDTLALSRALGLGTFDEHRTLEGGWHRVAGAFPVSALADEILCDSPDRIRALFISAGNPVHSVPSGEGSLRRALGELDLLVSVDLYRNESAATADYVLPATDMLERSDFPVSHVALQEKAYAQYTPAVVSPLFDRRTEAWIFSELAQASGASPFGKSICNWLPPLNRGLAKLPGRPQITTDHLISLLLRWGGTTTLDRLKAAPSGVLLPPTAAGSFLGKSVPTADGKVNLAPQSVLADLPRLEASAGDFGAPGANQLYLIGRRDRRSHNSWMHNNPRIRQPEGNFACMHPDDAAARRLAEGDHVTIGEGSNAIRLAVRISDEVAPGVLAVPHGWGHDGSGVPRAAELEGANVNRAIPGGPMHMEPVSGQAIMLAHRVRVAKA